MNILKKFKSNAGYTLTEVMVMIFIFVIIVSGTLSLYNDTVNTNNALSNNLNAQMEVRKAFNSMAEYIRSASQSSLGSYTIESASSTALTFFSDIDSDGLKERIRYFKNGNALKVGILKPTGNPLVYNNGNEVVNFFIHNVVNNGTSPIFTYYDDTYNGAGASLAYPLNIPGVRLIKIDILIDQDPLKAPAAIQFTTQVTIRSLKDNL